MILRYARSGPRDFLYDGVIVNSRKYWEFYMVSEGELSLVLPDDSGLELKASTIWMMPKSMPYGWAGPGVATRHMAQFYQIPEAVEKILLEHGHITRSLDSSELQQMIRYFKTLEDLGEKIDVFSELQVEKSVLDMCLLIFSKFDSPDFSLQGKGDEMKIIQACDWYLENMNQSPSLHDVAEQVHLSEGYFRRLFRRLRDHSPHGFFMELRMNRAKKLLLEGSLSMDRLAEECGFASSSAFHRAFKQHIQLTPRQWLRSLRD